MTGIKDEFRFLLDVASTFLPKTQTAALKAVEGGYLPESAFIFKGVNIRPVFEEPYDLMDLERLLAKPNLDFETVFHLIQVFEKMIQDPDKELALFAAESINTVEVRYIHRIQKLKKSLETDYRPEVARRLLKAFFDLGRLNFNRPVLKTFYLQEARQVLEVLWAQDRVEVSDWETLVLILLELRLPLEAENLLNSLIAEQRQDPRLFLWMARVKFVQRDYLQVMAILAFLNADQNLPEALPFYRFWMGEEDLG